MPASLIARMLLKRAIKKAAKKAAKKTTSKKAAKKARTKKMSRQRRHPDWPVRGSIKHDRAMIRDGKKIYHRDTGAVPSTGLSKGVRKGIRKIKNKDQRIQARRKAKEQIPMHWKGHNKFTRWLDKGNGIHRTAYYEEGRYIKNRAATLRKDQRRRRKRRRGK